MCVRGALYNQDNSQLKAVSPFSEGTVFIRQNMKLWVAVARHKAIQVGEKVC